MKDDHGSYHATFAVAKRKPEKKNSSLYGIRSLDLCDTGAVLLVECCTGIVEVKGSNSVQAGISFKLSFPSCKSLYITAMIILHLSVFVVVVVLLFFFLMKP